MNSKKNLLQSLLFLAIVAVCSFSFSACSDDDDIDETKLIGKWQYTNVTGTIKITGNGMSEIRDLSAASEVTGDKFEFLIDTFEFSEDGIVKGASVDEDGKTSYATGRWSIKGKSLYIDNQMFARISKLEDGIMTLSRTESGKNYETNMEYSISANLHFTKVY